MFKTVICAAALMLCTSVSAQNATENVQTVKSLKSARLLN